ncbi:MAG: cytochrome c biogenesis CcdA family protein, partial [Clostridia bacterium]
MQYVITFFEGIITFISPCLLPMLPIYISYFAGGYGEDKNSTHVLRGALGFIAGFTLVFIALGALSGSIGVLLSRHATLVNVITGLIVIVFGLSYLNIIRLPFLQFGHKSNGRINAHGFFPALLFGVVFSIGWTPCVGAFLGSALMLASNSRSTLQGILMLLSYSLGLAIPFLISALMLARLRSTFDFIKRHYKV